ncbi:MAG: ABC transporter ATP-binding protein [Bacilli bacterium]|nr:ABC transporter ATP-binding protein [Bacilli bacterium]
MPRIGNRESEKAKDFKNSIKLLIISLKRWHISIIICLILAFASAILALIAPDKLSNLTDYIAEGLVPRITQDTVTEIMNDPNISLEDKQTFLEISSSIDKDNQELLLKKIDDLPLSIYEKIKPIMNMKIIKKLSLFLASLYLISALLSYVQQIIMAYVTNYYSRDLRGKITAKINKLPLKYFDNHETGDVLSRMTNDVDSISQGLNQSLASLIVSITLLIGSIFMMFKTNAILAITGIFASLFGFLFMGIILSKSQKYFNERQQQLGKLNGYIEEMYSGHNVVQTTNAIAKTNEEFDRINNKLFNCSRNSQFLSGIMPPMMGFVGNLGYVAVCVVGALLALHNTISFGVIIAFMVYIRLFTNPLSQIAQATTSLQTTAAASERVFEFLDEEQMPQEDNLTKKIDKNNLKGQIEFKNVSFGYNDDKKVIKNFSAIAKPGQKIAIVGPTGAGKTTIVNLLMKFYDMKDGDILINDISIKELKRENIHDLFVMVLQDTWLFSGTIKENLSFNNKNISKKEIWEACKTVGIDHFIKTLPKGLNAEIKDGESISQGQKQLLTIARGILKDAPFIILDEATSNVDSRTEVLVQNAMDKLIKGKTSFIIAHRLSTIKNADLILVMNEGNIVEVGNHEELLAKKGYYADIYNSQFSI